MESNFEYPQLQKDLAPFNKVLGEAAETILNENISHYPIFIVHQHDLEIGIPIIHQEPGKSNWSVHASTLEELVTKKIIGSDKVDDFRKIFKDVEQFLCLFLLREEGATFVFLPRK